MCIVLADNRTKVRFGQRTLLEQRPGMEVVGEAVDGLEAMEMVETHHHNSVPIEVRMPQQTA